VRQRRSRPDGPNCGPIRRATNGGATASATRTVASWIAAAMTVASARPQKIPCSVVRGDLERLGVAKGPGTRKSLSKRARPRSPPRASRRAVSSMRERWSCHVWIFVKTVIFLLTLAKANCIAADPAHRLMTDCYRQRDHSNRDKADSSQGHSRPTSVP
jgi:hypothetical protein